MKKRWIAVGIVLVLLAGAAVYFWPRPLSGSLEPGEHMSITITNMGVRNGEAYMEPEQYDEITEVQQAEIAALLDEYSYMRTLTTAFSDGSMEGLGDRVLVLHWYNDTGSTASLSVSAEGQVALGNRTYRMGNAPEFLDRVTEILSA